MNKRNILITLGLCIASLLFGYHISRKSPKEVIKYEKTIDTLYLERKVIEEKIVEKVKWRDKLIEQEKEIVYDTIICKKIVDNLKEQLSNCDSIVVFKDKIITKTDSVVVFKDKIIEVYKKPKHKWFSVGVQGGYNPIDKKPYYGVGVGINIFNF